MENTSTNTNSSIREIMKMARESYNTSMNQTASLMEASYKISTAFLKEAAKWSTEEFDTMSDDDIKMIYNSYYIGSAEAKLLQPEDMRKDLKACKGLSNTAYEMQKSFKEVQDLYNESVDEDWKRRNSKEYRDATLKRIEEWKSEIEKMDPVKDAKMIRDLRQKVEFMESTITLDFITERIKHVEKEKSTIMRQFFSESEGSYSLNRCKSRSPKFGFDADWYKFFFNLEENFLPEEYHAFNNLFLFNVMRFIGYQDPYNAKDRGMVQAIVSSLTGLVYHKFADTEMENVIISLIKDYDSYFEDQREKFMKDNTTRPNHPVRLEQSKKADADRRNELFAAMVKFNFEVPENAAEISTRDLQEYFNNKMEEMVSKNTKEKELHGDAETTEEDGVTTIRPTFLKDKYRNPVDLIDGKFYYFNQDEKGQESYKKVLNYFKAHDCKIGYQMFELKNPDVRTDVFAEDLTDGEKRAILEECTWNFWFFWRYVLKLQVNVNTLLTIDSMLADHNTLEETMRQSGKTTTITAYGTWANLFHKDHYPKVVLVGRDMSCASNIGTQMKRRASDVPEFLRSHVNNETIHLSGTLEDATKYLSEMDDIPENSRVLVIMDDMECIKDIEHVEDLKTITKLKTHVIMSSIPNDPDKIPRLMEKFQKDRELIYYPYQLNKDTHCDFFTAVKQHNFQDTNAIAYITVGSRRLRTTEELTKLVQSLGTLKSVTDGFLVREVWCKHVSDKFVQYCKVNGIDITAEGYDPFIANTFRTENRVEIKSILGDANQLPETWRSDDPKISPLDDVAYMHEEPASTDAFDSSSINQLKEKMDNEGTYSVTDALSGNALKPRK
nr:MAG TPA: large terminase [Caudoviricetes sp.]